MASPQISVVTPAFNSGRHIAETLEAVLAQTFTDWELIVVDDGSTDNTRDVVGHYVNDRIHLLTHDGMVNRGACMSRIVGTEHAQGRVIALLDADDIWDEYYLEKHLAFWDSVERFGVAMSYGRARIWHPAAPEKDSLSDIPAVGVHPPAGLLDQWHWSWFGRGPECPSAVFLRPEIYPQIRHWADLARGSVAEDQYLFWHVGVRFPVAVHGGAWLRYRKHEASAVARAGRDRYRWTLDHLALYEALQADLRDVLPGHPVTESLPERVAALRKTLSWRGKASHAVRHRFAL